MHLIFPLDEAFGLAGWMELSFAMLLALASVVWNYSSQG